jgi:hypothetical protein
LHQNKFNFQIVNLLVRACEKSKYLESQGFNKLPETEFYSAQNMEIVGNNLKLTIGFSGCDDEVKPTLYINSPRLGAPFAILN